MSQAPNTRRIWYQRIGPGLITACVVIGPGSILTSSQVGSTHGYALSWVVVVAVAFMMVYTSLGARLGVVAGQSPGTLIACRAGRWLSVLIGLSVFLISAAFQFGNNLGVHSAFLVYVDHDYIIVVFNVLSLAFVFGFKNLYRAMERLMMAFVGLMLLSFAVNLYFAKPDLVEFAAGFVPGLEGSIDVSILGLVGTTFVMTVAFFQSYLVRQKGWQKDSLRDGLVDARIGSVIMALITLMIMATAAAVLRGEIGPTSSVGDIANQLHPLFGSWGQGLFCLGLFSAAYSSFLINSMIGGFVLSDGLGLGDQPTDWGPRVFTAAVLLTGMAVALYVIQSGVKPIPAIVAAQAVTVVASPLLAGILLWLTNSRRIMGEARNGAVSNVFAAAGWVLLLAMAWYTATYKVWPAIRNQEWDTASRPESSSSLTMAQQRAHLDATVWAAEVEAQRHEQPLIALWDRLRAAKDQFAELATVPFVTMTVGQPQDRAEELGLGIRRTTLSAAHREYGPQEFQRALDKLRRQGFRIVQTEWHHARFDPAAGDGRARSEIRFVLHATRDDGASRETVRYIVRGTLLISWSNVADAQGHPRPERIETGPVEILWRSGEPAFRHLLTASHRNESYTSAMPVIVYDLDGDGDSEIILSRWNRVYWNDGRGKFREGSFLERFKPHWETGIVADFNGDANADFLTVGTGDHPILYHGEANGRFPHEGRSCSNVRLDEPSAITAGDVDGDGDLDLWLPQYRLAYRGGQMPTPYYDANDGFPAYLLLNDGAGQFVDSTAAAGLAQKRCRRTYSSSFVDLDDDTDLDLLVVSDFAGLDLYQNSGHGHFTDVTDTWIGQHHLFGMSHTLADYNLDGRLDLYVIGMSSTTARRLDFLGLGRDDRPDVHRMRPAMAFGNRMYVRDGGRFVAPPYAGRVARTGWSWGTTSADFDNDGDPDIYVGNGFRSGRSSQDYCTRYWCHDIYTGTSQPNPDVERFLADSVRPLDEGAVSWNGYEHNALWMNLDGHDFVNVAFLLGVAFEYDARCVISDDLNGDGLCDLLVAESIPKGHGFQSALHVYQNRLDCDNHWIGVRLREAGPGGSPLGAKVRLKTRRGVQVACIVAGDSFMSQHASTVHFGLGAETEVESIEVRWPNGRVQRLPRPSVDTYHDLSPPK